MAWTLSTQEIWQQENKMFLNICRTSWGYKIKFEGTQAKTGFVRKTGYSVLGAEA